MSTTNLTRLNVALTLTTGAFTRSTSAAIKSAEALGSGLRSALLSPIGAITGALSAGAFIAGVNSAANRIDNLAKAADRLAITTQSLAGLRLAAEQSGIAAGDMDQAMDKLQQTVQKAVAGNKEAISGFQALKIPLDDLMRLPVDQQLARVADAMNGLQTKGERTAATMALFGESGGKLSNVLALGSKGLDQAAQDAEKFGLALSRVDAAKVEDAKRSFDNVGRVIDGVWNNVAVKLSPIVGQLAEDFIRAATESKAFGSTIDKIINIGTTVVGGLADAWQTLQIIFQSLRVGVARFGQGMTEAGNTSVMAAQWIGAKFSQAWTLIQSGASVMWNVLRVGWSAARIPVFDFIQWTGSGLANLITAISESIGRLSPKMAAALYASASGLQRAVGDMSVTARAGFDQNVADLKASAESVVTNTQRLFSDVQTTGSATLKSLAADFKTLGDEEQAALAKMKAANWNSDDINAWLAKAQADAQTKAAFRASQIAAEQNDINRANGAKADTFLQYTSWSQGIAETDMEFRRRMLKQGLENSDKFFNNLSVLQQSSSKKAQSIGEAAARIKIGTDTAQAVMGCWASLSGIPFVGPALAVAAAGAAIAAGAVQMQNVGKSSVGDSGFSAPSMDAASSNVSGPARAGQTLILQGDMFSAESLQRMFAEAKEQGYAIDGVRRA